MDRAIEALEPVAWRNGCVELIDQTILPGRYATITYSDWREVAEAIRIMVVRGAPAIGCTAGLGMALAARQLAEAGDAASFPDRLAEAAAIFRATRPTAVNLFWAVDRLLAVASSAGGSPQQIAGAMLADAQNMVREDIETNRRMGRYGAELLPDDACVLTHCNAGALATAGYGTALGVIRAAAEAGKRVRVYADETRPRLQGMKLTAWELHRDGIDVTIITDNMAAVLMRDGRIDCVVVGADRIAANGDTANKIGTYGVAVLAHHHGIPFYVAAPYSTIDTELPDGAGIPIEERDACEVTHIDGVRVAPEGVPVWNPAFDVTPNHLITAIITERGVLRSPFDGAIAAAG